MTIKKSILTLSPCIHHFSDPHPAQTYCQYSCFQAGVAYPDFNNCCPDVAEVFVEDGSKGVADEPGTADQPATAVDPDAPCVLCTDIPDEYMLDNGVDCLTDNGLDELCAVDGSWWYNVRDWDDDWVDPYPAETYCQYTCDQMGLGYPSASPCCAERGSDVNEFYDYGTPDAADAVTEVPAVETPEPTSMPTPEATPDFGDLEVNGDCDGENDEFCALCEGDCDDDIDVSSRREQMACSCPLIQHFIRSNTSLSFHSFSLSTVRGWILLLAA